MGVKAKRALPPPLPWPGVGPGAGLVLWGVYTEKRDSSCSWLDWGGGSGSQGLGLGFERIESRSGTSWVRVR